MYLCIIYINFRQRAETVHWPHVVMQLSQQRALWQLPYCRSNFQPVYVRQRYEHTVSLMVVLLSKGRRSSSSSPNTTSAAPCFFFHWDDVRLFSSRLAAFFWIHDWLLSLIYIRLCVQRPEETKQKFSSEFYRCLFFTWGFNLLMTFYVLIPNICAHISTFYSLHWKNILVTVAIKSPLKIEILL